MIKQCWKTVVAIAGGLAIIMVILGVDDRYFKKAEAKEEFQQIKQSMQLDRDLSKLESINKQLMDIGILMVSHPNDKRLKAMQDVLEAEKKKAQESINKK